jgi:hypothetical protein
MSILPPKQAQFELISYLFIKHNFTLEGYDAYNIKDGWNKNNS